EMASTSPIVSRRTASICADSSSFNFASVEAARLLWDLVAVEDMTCLRDERGSAAIVRRTPRDQILWSARLAVRKNRPALSEMVVGSSRGACRRDDLGPLTYGLAEWELGPAATSGWPSCTVASSSCSRGRLAPAMRSDC